ncbi:hypothetical protein MRX96_009087 [Rhipicephalus microplus]
MRKFCHYDGIAYVSATIRRELVSIKKTVLMNYGTHRSEVMCRTYVHRTLVSEKVAYNLEDAKLVLDCTESLHPCRGAGRETDFTCDVLAKKLQQQISHSDGLVFSVPCKGVAKQQDENGLLQKNFATLDRWVSVDPVWETYLRDRRVRTLKVMPNLTETHLERNFFEKMRTTFAFQLFVSYVLRGLAFYKEYIERRCSSIVHTQLFSKIQ